MAGPRRRLRRLRPARPPGLPARLPGELDPPAHLCLWRPGPGPVVPALDALRPPAPAQPLPHQLPRLPDRGEPGPERLHAPPRRAGGAGHPDPRPHRRTELHAVAGLPGLGHRRLRPAAAVGPVDAGGLRRRTALRLLALHGRAGGRPPEPGLRPPPPADPGHSRRAAGHATPLGPGGRDHARALGGGAVPRLTGDLPRDRRPGLARHDRPGLGQPAPGGGTDRPGRRRRGLGRRVLRRAHRLPGVGDPGRTRPLRRFGPRGLPVRRRPPRQRRPDRLPVARPGLVGGDREPLHHGRRHRERQLPRGAAPARPGRPGLAEPLGRPGPVGHAHGAGGRRALSRAEAHGRWPRHGGPPALRPPRPPAGLPELRRRPVRPLRRPPLRRPARRGDRPAPRAYRPNRCRSRRATRASIGPRSTTRR